jgi:hypothetical protein
MTSDRASGGARTRVADALSAVGSRSIVGFSLLVLVVSVVPVPGSSGGEAAFFTLSVGVDPFVASHLLAYAIIAGLCRRTLRERDFEVREAAVIAVVLAAGYGATIELLQVPIPWRSGGPFDAAINAVGAVVGVLVGTIAGALARTSTR